MFKGEYHLCIDECVNNICGTPLYSTMSITGRKLEAVDKCVAETNILNQSFEQKLITKPTIPLLEVYNIPKSEPIAVPITDIDKSMNRNSNNSSIMNRNSNSYSNSFNSFNNNNDNNTMQIGPVSQIKTNAIIDWVRHAESCANLEGDIHVDKNIYTKRPLGYGTYIPIGNDIGRPESGNIIEKTAARFTYEPNLSFIGMQHAIKLGDFLKEQKYDIIICSPLTRTVQTGLLALRSVPNTKIYVVPYISEIQNLASFVGKDNQNTGVSSTILKQRIAFIKDWLGINWLESFDDIEVIGDIISVQNLLKKYVEYPDAVILVNEIDILLNCKKSKGKIDTLDINIKKYSECYNVKTIINKITAFFSFKGLSNSFTQKYNRIRNNYDSFLRGPPVDFSILEEFEEKFKQASPRQKKELDTHNPNLHKFYTDIIPLLYDKVNKKQDEEIKILCISHGSLIRYVWSLRNQETFKANEKELNHMKNTCVVQEKDKNFRVIYDPPLIRSSFENFESLNPNVCSLQSIKGVTNLNLSEQGKNTVMNGSFDVKFFDESYKQDYPNVLY